MNRDVVNLLSKNSAEYIRNFTDEIVATSTFVQSILKIILDSILIFAFFIFLMFFNPLTTGVVFIFFSSLGIVYFALVKNKLSKWATTSLSNRKKKFNLFQKVFLQSNP